jgi:hypothetical protein
MAVTKSMAREEPESDCVGSKDTDSTIAFIFDPGYFAVCRQKTACFLTYRSFEAKTVPIKRIGFYMLKNSYPKTPSSFGRFLPPSKTKLPVLAFVMLKKDRPLPMQERGQKI